MNAYQYPKTPLLTPEEEVELAMQVQEGLEAKAALDEAPAITAVKRRELRKKVKEGEDAQDHFICANIGLVRKEVQRYTPSGCDPQDMMQEGTIGLVHAVQKFDHQRGFRFSTYAMWWIRQAVTRTVETNRSMLRVAGPMQTRIRSLNSAQQALLQELGREPTDAELEATTNIPAEDMPQMRAWGATTRSIDAPVRSDDEGSRTLSETIEDLDAVDAYRAIESAGIGDVIDQIKSILSEEEFNVFEMYYLSDQRHPRTMVKQHRHLFRKAKSKLRHPSSDVALAAAAYL